MRHTNGRSCDVYGAAGPPGTMPPNPITHTNGRSRDMYGAWGRALPVPPDRIAHRNVVISLMNCNDQDRPCIVTTLATNASERITTNCNDQDRQCIVTPPRRSRSPEWNEGEGSLDGQTLRGVDPEPCPERSEGAANGFRM